MPYSLAQLKKEEQERLEQIEKELGLILIAYEHEHKQEQQSNSPIRNDNIQ